MVGIDPDSDGLARAARLGVATTARGRRRPDGAAGLRRDRHRLRRDSAQAHIGERRGASRRGKRSIDLTPGGDRALMWSRRSISTTHLDARERQHGDLRRPGDDPDRRGGLPGHAGALRRDRRLDRVEIGRARAPARTSTSSPRPPRTPSRRSAAPPRGKAIIILNPAEPPLIMRDTVFCLTGDADAEADARPRSTRWCRGRSATFPATGSSRRSSSSASAPTSRPDPIARPGQPVTASRSAVFLEVEGAAHYLPAYAGNLDIMTSAALRVGERIAERLTFGDALGMSVDSA